ncbi:MAG: hypothetical protein NUW37_06645 [Planctomycetes bacterium]|nr:hypothetical protein [Planctomycetota bacterium]
MSTRSVTIGTDTRIDIEVFNPDTGKSIPEFTLEEAGLSFAWNEDRPKWMYIVDDPEDSTQGFNYVEYLDDYSDLRLFIMDDPLAVSAPLEERVAEPGEYELPIEVFNERGLISDAKTRVRVVSLIATTTAVTATMTTVTTRIIPAEATETKATTGITTEVTGTTTTAATTTIPDADKGIGTKTETEATAMTTTDTMRIIRDADKIVN